MTILDKKVYKMLIFSLSRGVSRVVAYWEVYLLNWTATWVPSSLETLS